MAITDSTNPLAGISGPGPYAKRTDLQYQSPEYGAGVQYEADKSAAPLGKTPDVPGATNTAVREAAARSLVTTQDAVTPLTAVSQRPNEDIMHGTDVGPGAGSEALMMGKATEKLSDVLVKMLPYDTDGSIAVLYQDALARGN
jgi:hypothetical protein